MEKFLQYFSSIDKKIRKHKHYFPLLKRSGYIFDVYVVQKEREIPHVTISRNFNGIIQPVAKVKLPPKDAYYLKPDYIYVMWYNREYFKTQAQLTWFKHTMCKIFITPWIHKCEGGYFLDQTSLEDMWDYWGFIDDIKSKYMITPTSKEYPVQPPSEETFHFYSHHD